MEKEQMAVSPQVEGNSTNISLVNSSGEDVKGNITENGGGGNAESINTANESLKSLLLGKFEKVEDLEKAYTNLESEFTKKSQRLKELEAKAVTVADENPFYQRENWQESVHNFMKANPQAREYKSEIANVIFSDETVANSKDCLSLAWAKVISQNNSLDGDITQNKNLMEKILNNSEIKERIINEYLKSINAPKTPFTLDKGGEISVTPPSKPRTLEDAKRLAEKYILRR